MTATQAGPGLPAPRSANVPSAPANPQAPPTEQEKLERALWNRVKREYRNAFDIAKQLLPVGTTGEVIQKATATILIHYKELRYPRQSGGGGRGGGGQQQRPAQTVAPIPCPSCGGAMYDNRNDKKSPGMPDYRCKSKTCKDDSGRTTGVWLDAQGNPKPPKQPPPPKAQPAPSGNQGSFGDFPEGLDQEDDDLPF